MRTPKSWYDVTPEASHSARHSAFVFWAGAEYFHHSTTIVFENKQNVPHFFSLTKDLFVNPESMAILRIQDAISFLVVEE